MLVSEIYTEIRNEANVNSTKASDSFLLSGVNLDYGELRMSALRARGDYNFGINEATTDLKSTSGLVSGNTGFNGEYAWPSDCLRPVRMEVSFDGTNFYKATIYDISDNISVSEHVESEINNAFSQTSPFVRVERNSFFIRPLKTTAGDVTNGIHIWYEQRGDALSASDTPPIEPNFHRLFVLMGVLRIMRKFRNEYTLNDRQEIKNEINQLKIEMMQFYTKQVDENLILSPAYISYE